MVTKTQRRVTEEEVLFAEEAFSEFEGQGATEKKCPWCAGDLRFTDAISGYGIHCTECDFKVTVRGI